MSNLLDLLQSISTHENINELNVSNAKYYDMNASKGSTFIDIGSGFGKPVFHAAMQTACPSYGVEIVPARVLFCEDQKYNFMESQSED
jgi:16S rRNA G527 N7-methylase RsmG